jgi:hypothetical protein
MGVAMRPSGFRVTVLHVLDHSRNSLRSDDNPFLPVYDPALG